MFAFCKIIFTFSTKNYVNKEIAEISRIVFKKLCNW